MGFVPASFAGLSAGTIEAWGTASLYLNSGSGALRLMVTVRADAFELTPPLSVHVAAFFRQASAPMMPA